MVSIFTPEALGMQDRIVDRGTTFDDVLLQPQCSDVINVVTAINNANLHVKVLRSNIWYYHPCVWIIDKNLTIETIK